MAEIFFFVLKTVLLAALVLLAVAAAAAISQLLDPEPLSWRKLRRGSKASPPSSTSVW